MAGRSHPQPNALKLREAPLARNNLPQQNPLIGDSRFHHRLSHPSSSASGLTRGQQLAILEDRIDAQHREIQSLLSDNQRLASTHVALKQEVAASQQELRLLSATAAKVKAERDAEVREVYDRSLRMDAEVRGIDAMRAELVQVRGDVQQLSAMKQELTSELQSIEGELGKAYSDLKQLPLIKAEIESMHHEVQKGRAAIECEKKTHMINLEHGRSMEKTMTSLSQEIEKLKAELADAEKRARAAAAANPTPGYPPSYGNPDMRYGGKFYSDPYAMHQFQAGTVQHYATAAMNNGPYNLQGEQS